MTALTIDDYEDLLNLLRTVLECPTPERPWPVITRELRRHLRGTAAVVLEVCWEDKRVRAEVWEGEQGDPDDAVLRHPLLRRFAESPDIAPLAGAERRGEDPLFPTAGRQALIAVPLAMPGPVLRVLVVGRHGAGFSAGECAFVRRIQPLLMALDRGHLGTPACAPPCAPGPEVPRLTPRERAVLELLAEAHTAAGMAQRLGLAERTVTKHLEHVYRKLKTCDRLGTVLRAQRLGLLPERLG
jgi:DNA-binding CsgD family transcriptional regulator